MLKIALLTFAVLLVYGEAKKSSSSSGEHNSSLIRARYLGYTAKTIVSRAKHTVEQIAMSTTRFEGKVLSRPTQICLDRARQQFILQNTPYVQTLYEPIIKTTDKIEELLGGKMSKKERKKLEKQLPRLLEEISQQMRANEDMVKSHLREDAITLKHEADLCLREQHL
ncbi:hypothetical protein AAG570_001422 [Ranatra chinensis]|uniref:Uncharacterized protein n=1 Tax=Ranatra chinensis TaxID=642074 RepID=A0ABD0YBU1_9HEMI